MKLTTLIAFFTILPNLIFCGEHLTQLIELKHGEKGETIYFLNSAPLPSQKIIDTLKKIKKSNDRLDEPLSLLLYVEDEVNYGAVDKFLSLMGELEIDQLKITGDKAGLQQCKATEAISTSMKDLGWDVYKIQCFPIEPKETRVEPVDPANASNAASVNLNQSDLCDMQKN